MADERRLSEPGSTGPAGRSSPQGWAAWYALSLLAFGNLLSYLDRNIVFALFEPIKRDLGVTDAQLGWLGSAYAIVFSIGSLFAGVVSDLSSRRAVLAGGLALWSAFTAAGGLVRNYAQLFASRALVGIGQSSYLPAAQALLADYFPTRGRAQALGIFWVGLALGGVLAVYLGGVLTTALGWRDTLVVIGLPGVAFAALLWRLRDPAERPRLPLARSERAKFRIRARVVWRVLAPLVLSLLLGTAAFGFLALFKGLPPEADTAAFGIVAGTGVAWTVFGWVRRLLKSQHLIPVGSPADVIDEMLDAGAMVLRTPTLIWLFIGGALTSAAMNALVAWSASFLQRELGLSLLEAASRIGPAGLLGGILGSWAGGRLGDTLMERLASGRVIAAALGFIIGAPLCVMMLLLTSPKFAAPLFFVVVFFYMWYNGPVAAVLFDVVPREVGATVMGAYVFFIHIAGDAIALPAIGALSDRIGLRAALLTCPLIGLLGGVVLLFAVFTVRRDMARVRTPAV